MSFINLEELTGVFIMDIFQKWSNTSGEVRESVDVFELKIRVWFIEDNVLFAEYLQFFVFIISERLRRRHYVFHIIHFY